MNLDTILDQIESGILPWKVLSKLEMPGLGEAYFGRLVSYYGSDNKKLNRLGKLWKEVLNFSPDKAWVYRAGGLYFRTIGEWESSAEAFISAGKAATDAISKFSFQVGGIDSLARAGKLHEAHFLAKLISRNLKKLGQPALAARALLNLGNAYIYQDRMIEARKVLLIALPELELAGLELEAASAKLGLASSYLFGGFPRFAEDYANQVIASSAKLGADHLADLARLDLALCMTITGRSEEAHRILLEIKPRLEDSPVDEAFLGEYLGDALFRLNLWPESEDTYRDLLQSKTPLIPLHRANIELGLGQTLLAQEKFNEAQSYFSKALKRYSILNNRVWESVCLLHMSIVDVENSKIPSALKRLDKAELCAIESPYHTAQILLAQSRLGQNRLNEASRIIRANGYLDLEWQVHFLKTQSSKLPHKHFKKMFSAILTSRVATRSVAARMGFLKDKAQAIQAYLSWLLLKPNAERVTEAIEVIQQIRAATLLEEILRSGALPDNVMEQLEKLRKELVSSIDEEPKGLSRSRTQNSIAVRQTQKTANQALLSLDILTRPISDSQNDCVVIAETLSGLKILNNSEAFSPKLDDAQILNSIKWLSFEMLEPMTESTASSKSVNNLLDQLAGAFEPLWEIDSASICPDRFSWRIPWALVADRAGVPKEWNLALHPSLISHYTSHLNDQSRACIWLGESRDLPFAEKEIEAISNMFQNCTFVTDKQGALESLQSSYEIIHVVSHAIHQPINPMLSSIVFPDGPLFAYEIARSEFNAKLATLSACETGAISLATRSEPDGIARAFLSRGCESVVASQWPLDDEAAFIQFQELYKNLFAKKPIQTALFDAKCSSKKWKQHPYYWGALALYSGYQNETDSS